MLWVWHMEPNVDGMAAMIRNKIRKDRRLAQELIDKLNGKVSTKDQIDDFLLQLTATQANHAQKQEMQDGLNDGFEEQFKHIQESLEKIRNDTMQPVIELYNLVSSDDAELQEVEHGVNDSDESSQNARLERSDENDNKNDIDIQIEITDSLTIGEMTHEIGKRLQNDKKITIGIS